MFLIHCFHPELAALSFELFSLREESKNHFIFFFHVGSVKVTSSRGEGDRERERERFTEGLRVEAAVVAAGTAGIAAAAAAS